MTRREFLAAMLAVPFAPAIAARRAKRRADLFALIKRQMQDAIAAMARALDRHIYADTAHYAEPLDLSVLESEPLIYSAKNYSASVNV